ncbi:MAG: formate/nitrite transporter family protein [Clostridiales bacterium]|jgi:formate/nitrite transporter|nr:formate/nitrite transporter family protein [Clostridiales bacterium]
MYSPAEIANNYIDIGENKSKNPVYRALILAVFAGAFIALAAVGATVIGVTVESKSIAKLLQGLVFPTGLAMVVIAGSELFTGNNLMIIPVLEKRITLSAMLKSWVIFYVGNFIGSVLIALLVVYGNVFGMIGGLAESAVKTAEAKVSMSFGSAVLKGILCNFLVCIAVWMTLGAKTAGGKIAALYLPIMLFILCGYEHSVANMYYLTAAIFAQGKYEIASGTVYWGSIFAKNLLPVTIGNIIGGAGLVGLGYWAAYLKKSGVKRGAASRKKESNLKKATEIHVR